MHSPMTGSSLLDYWMEHVTPNCRPAELGFYQVRRPVYAFKAVWSSLAREPAIANLILPEGTDVYAHRDVFTRRPSQWDIWGQRMPQMGTRKMRASQAYVHSIYTIDSPRRLQIAYSDADSMFNRHAAL